MKCNNSYTVYDLIMCVCMELYVSVLIALYCQWVNLDPLDTGPNNI